MQRCNKERALLYFSDLAALLDFFRRFAKHTDPYEDPILGSGNDCSYWYGDTEIGNRSSTLQATLNLADHSSEEAQVQRTWVNRLLAFLFMDDESFMLLMALPKEPLVMSCGNQLCICVRHISCDVGAAQASPCRS
mmetsp:Transcript_1639/g.2746  ORF Transcript_1639/g.2746 Transcript_1639/m.2746 type:complete len:136 (+) Transcript_1639:2-409(+)